MELPVDGTLALVDTKIVKPKVERKEKTMWNDALTQLFLTHRFLLRGEFAGKSINSAGLLKVYTAMCASNLQLVQSRHVTPTSLASKWKQFQKTVKAHSDKCNRSGEGNSEPKPQYYDEIMECLGSEGQVAVRGLRIGRDSSAGTRRVGYWSADNLLDSQYPEYIPKQGRNYTEEGEDPELDDNEEPNIAEEPVQAEEPVIQDDPPLDNETEDEDVKEIPRGNDKDTPTKRMS